MRSTQTEWSRELEGARVVDGRWVRPTRPLPLLPILLAVAGLALAAALTTALVLLTRAHGA